MAKLGIKEGSVSHRLKSGEGLSEFVTLSELSKILQCSKGNLTGIIKRYKVPFHMEKISDHWHLVVHVWEFRDTSLKR